MTALAGIPYFAQLMQDKGEQWLTEVFDALETSDYDFSRFPGLWESHLAGAAAETSDAGDVDANAAGVSDEFHFSTDFHVAAAGHDLAALSLADAFVFKSGHDDADVSGSGHAGPLESAHAVTRNDTDAGDAAARHAAGAHPVNPAEHVLVL